MVACSLKQCGARRNKDLPSLTVHKFPAKESLRMKWLEIIGTENLNPHKHLFICSLHFEEASFNRTLEVVRLRDDAVPASSLLPERSLSTTNLMPESAEGHQSNRHGFELKSNTSNGPANKRRRTEPSGTMEFCRICFAASCKLFELSRHRNISRLYETLTGLSPAGEVKLPSLVCGPCARSLIEFARLRAVALRAHLLILQVASDSPRVTLEAIKKIAGNEEPKVEPYESEYNEIEYLEEETGVKSEYQLDPLADAGQKVEADFDGGRENEGGIGDHGDKYGACDENSDREGDSLNEVKKKVVTKYNDGVKQKDIDESQYLERPIVSKSIPDTIFNDNQPNKSKSDSIQRLGRDNLKISKKMSDDDQYVLILENAESKLLLRQGMEVIAGQYKFKH